MDGKGWKPHYGISSEGIELLGYVEALPQEARRELLQAVAEMCRREGYLSLHDDLRTAVGKARTPRASGPEAADVIPLFRGRQRG